MMDATEAWVSDLRRVLAQAHHVSPRGQPTFEVVGYTSPVVDMTRPVLTSPARKLGYRFMAAEAAWILSGDDRVETIAPFSREISKFSDDGVVFAGAYGPKVVGQLDYVVDCLVRDVDSRQAVLSIWRESPGPSRDVPCTLSAQFLVRGGHLHCVDSMRSSDLWLGHPYDVFNFSMLSLGVLLKLRERGVELQLGGLTLHAGSKHVYLRDMDGVRACVDQFMGDRDDGKRHDPGPEVLPHHLGSYEDLVEHLWALAKSGKVAEQSSWVG